MFFSAFKPIFLSTSFTLDVTGIFIRYVDKIPRDPKGYQAWLRLLRENLDQRLGDLQRESGLPDQDIVYTSDNYTISRSQPRPEDSTFEFDLDNEVLHSLSIPPYFIPVTHASFYAQWTHSLCFALITCLVKTLSSEAALAMIPIDTPRAVHLPLKNVVTTGEFLLPMFLGPSSISINRRPW